MDIPNSLLALAAVAALAEFVWARRNNIPTYTRNETLASIGTAALNRLGQVVSVVWKYFVFRQVAQFVPWSIPTTVGTVIVAFLLAEFFYYWFHRASHEVPLMWSMHFTHHSSPEYNMLVAPRLSVLNKFLSPLFFIPMIAMGFSPELTAGAVTAGLFFQLFLHTEAVGKLGRLEGIINTPSAHRVHHGSNPQYIDRNYGGSLMIFDRLFGTYEPEGEKVRYGVTTGHWGYNPFVLQFKPFWMYITRNGWRREKQYAEQVTR